MGAPKQNREMEVLKQCFGQTRETKFVLQLQKQLPESLVVAVRAHRLHRAPLSQINEAR